MKSRNNKITESPATLPTTLPTMTGVGVFGEESDPLPPAAAVLVDKVLEPVPDAPLMFPATRLPVDD